MIRSFLILWMALSQQSPALVEGNIVEAGSGRPIGTAAVELRSISGTGVLIAATRTDPAGRFYLRNVAPGPYRLVASHPGHVTAEFGQRQPAGPGGILSLAPGQSVKDVRIAMTPAAVISGRITDKGQPAALADVVAIRAIKTEGRLSFTPVLATRTNDLGEYSLFWLPQGRYHIIAMVDAANSTGFYITPDGTDRNSFAKERFIERTVFSRPPIPPMLAPVVGNEAHIPIYYPGTSDPQSAMSIEVSPGGRMRGIDIEARAVPLGRVRGRVTGVTTRVSVDMRPLTWTIYTTPAQRPNATSDSFGNFEMSAVPGRYTLTAFSGKSESLTVVEVRGGDITNAVISLSRASTLTGRVVIERAAAIDPDPAMSALRVVFRPDPFSMGVSTYNVSIQPNGAFTIPSLEQSGVASDDIPPEGDYRVLVAPILLPPTQPGSTPPVIPAPLQSLYVKSIRMGDVDLLDHRLRVTSQTQESLTIVVGTNPGTLEGRVLDDRQQPVSGTTVVLVHDDGLRFRVDEKSASSDAAGLFTFQNVPPGTYKLFAWESIEFGAWQDPEFMQSFETRAVAVGIEEGRKTALDVNVIQK